eukprot:12402675-Karenia_brevis.AAC.1
MQGHLEEGSDCVGQHPLDGGEKERVGGEPKHKTMESHKLEKADEGVDRGYRLQRSHLTLAPSQLRG